MSKEAAYAKIAQLIERFSEQIDSYKKSSYNETQTRRDFIDPFFKALGWDVDNSAGNAEAYREVIHEAKTMVQEGAGERMKSPDYAFRLPGGKYLFFVEAKKPSVMIKDDVLPAYQVRRYGWSAKLAVSITTDFEEFAVYDCTKKPNVGDKASVARIKYLRYDQYLEEFDFLWDTFSKERVLKGSFDKFIQNDAARKGTASVDKEFLQSLDKWRTLLATNINANNRNLDEGELNFAVQQTIDRIIFLRIAEDRGVEEYGTLKKAVKSGTYYKNMLELFKSADEKYNSGLFNFDNDFVTTTMAVSNAAIKDIIIELYYPISPYEFSVLSVEILGSAYEQFLSKQIRIDAKGRATIEEKPSVRKAGGVYYTPQYIVDYIVQQTVGTLCKGKTPKAIESLTIIDPACGSGSFLLGAYDYLLRWHKEYYTNNPQPVKNRKEKPLTPDGHLTMAVKKQILLNNIYGVDIDVNAVEVTKLSLLLKCLEGETTASIQEQFSLWGGSILPTLDANIKSGNSLIGPDFYDKITDTEEARKIKPFNWQKAFTKVFKSGGFDAVIGNPPYIQSREGQLNETEKNYYYNIFKTTENQINTFGLFLEKGMDVLKEKGILGYIIPNYWLSTKFDKKLRKLLFQENYVSELINVYIVFEAAVVDTVVLTIYKGNPLKDKITTVKSIDSALKTIPERLTAIREENWKYHQKVKIDNDQDDIEISFKNTFDLKGEKQIGDYFDLKFGVKLYQVGKGKPAQIKSQATNKVFEATSKVNKDYQILLKARNIQRYFVKADNYWIHYGNHLAEPRNISLFKGDRILIQRIVSKDVLDGVFTDDDFVCNTDVITLKPKTDKVNCKFFLGILNSKLCAVYVKSKNVNLDRAAFPKINTKTLETFPIPDFKIPKEKAHHDEIVHHVENLLKLHTEKQTVTLATRRESIEDRIEHSEKKINDLVYTLYGITDEERVVIEG